MCFLDVMCASLNQHSFSLEFGSCASVQTLGGAVVYHDHDRQAQTA